MTREEAYNRIDAIIAKHEIDDEYVTITSFKDYDVRFARKLFEQEPILDKLRAEIENINVWGMRYNPYTNKDRKPQIVQKVKEHVIEIIDRYKAETEEV